MKTKILALIAIILAIPTFGASILIWIFIKYKYDKFVAHRVLMNAVVMSYEHEGQDEIRKGVNNAALIMFFNLFNGRLFHDGKEEDRSIRGVVKHPSKNIILVVAMIQQEGNKLKITAEESVGKTITVRVDKFMSIKYTVPDISSILKLEQITHDIENSMILIDKLKEELNNCSSTEYFKTRDNFHNEISKLESLNLELAYALSVDNQK